MDIEKLFEQHAKEDRDFQSELRDKLDGLNERFTKMEATMTRWQGFVGGMMFVVSLFWIVIGFFKEKIVEWLT